MGLNILSLFDGISCGRVALERCGIEVGNYYASEIKNNAIKVTMCNYPDTIPLGGVENINTDNLKDIDLLIGGSPCKDLSIAMKDRKGLRGEKSKLFFEYLRILEEVKPKYFLLENVSRMKKEDKEVITKLLGTEPIKINSKLVSGALRGRLYWTDIPNISQPQDKGIKLADIIDKGYTDREKARCLLASDSRRLTTPVKMFHRYYTGFTTLIFKDRQHYLDCKEHYEINFKGLPAKRIINDSSIYDGVRYFNQRELERLQTMPEGYTDVLTRDQAAEVLGDGWTIDIISHIFNSIKEE